MKRIPHLYIILLLISLSIIACTEEENFTDASNSYIDPAFDVYFQRFEEEAKARGFQYELGAEGISAIFDQLDGNIAGQCSQGHEIKIAPDYWRQATNYQKEFLIFHELGHCVLKRSHTDQANQGVCASIMTSGESDCRIVYNQRTRESYIDELFEPRQ